MNHHVEGGLPVQIASPVHGSLIAKWFVARSQRGEGSELDNLKLQKLLFLAQSRYSAVAGKPLIRESFEAWRHGPVLPTVYREYSEFRDGPISQELSPDGPWSRLEEEIEAALEEVWSAFGGYSGLSLRKITHEAGPWKRFFLPDVLHSEIPLADIQESWSDFESLESDEAVLRRRASEAIEKSRAVLRRAEPGSRIGDPQELLEDLDATDHLRREAGSSPE